MKRTIELPDINIGDTVFFKTIYGYMKGDVKALILTNDGWKLSIEGCNPWNYPYVHDEGSEWVRTEAETNGVLAENNRLYKAALGRT